MTKADYPGCPRHDDGATPRRFMAYGWLAARSGLPWSETDVFDTMAMWLVVVMFTIGLWLTVHAIWGMVSDSRARRSDYDAVATARRFRATRSP